MSEIMVSIICIAYNHENYIRQALDGFVMQKTDFKFEVLINDDASTDDTAKIIKEYEEKYPDTFFPVYQEKNLYSQGIDPTRILMDKARGKYFAFCEGDDYWVDENKLQKQVDVLEEHPEYSACVHNVPVVDEFGVAYKGVVQEQFRMIEDTVLGKEYLDSNCKVCHTSSYLGRKSLFDNMSIDQYEEFWKIKANGDLRVSAISLVNGKIYHIAEEMSCYRCVTTHGDSWSAKTSNKNIELITLKMLENVEEFVERYYNIIISYDGYYKKIAYSSIRVFIKRPTKENLGIAKSVLGKVKYSPKEFILTFVKHQLNKIVSRIK